MNPRPRILLIDDSEATVDGIKSFLAERYEVFTAINGMEGLKELKGNGMPFDLVITDLVMPIVGGSEVVSILKERFPSTPIIVMTGWEQNAIDLPPEAKPDVVLIKPFDLEDLDRSVSKLLPAKWQTPNCSSSGHCQH